MTTLVILGIITITILLYLHVTRRFNYWKNRNVPSNKPIPLFGNAFSIATQKESINSFLIRLYKSTTLPFFGFFVFDQPFILIREPELIKNVLVSDFDHFADRSLMENKSDKYASLTLFMLKQPKWQTVRTKVTSSFSSTKIKNMVPLALEASDCMVDYITNSCLGIESTNCRSITMKYAIDVISSCAFGLKVNSHQNSKFSTASKNLNGTSLSRLTQLAAHFFAPFLVTIFNFKFSDENAGKYLENIFLNTIKERKERRISRSDLVDLLIRMQAEDTILFNDQQIIGLSFQYLIAGFETSGATIAFVLYELCLNTPIQNRLRKEILSVIEKHEKITYEVIREMTYLDMVVKEGLRKYPPLPFLDRRCTKTYKIPNTDVIVDKGIPVYMSTMSLHHDEKYFKDPTKFDPERFSSENKSSIIPFTYMPFGEGYRNCLGMKFGMLTVNVALIKILTNFEISISKVTPSALQFENGGFLIIPKDDVIFVKFNKAE